MYISDTDNAANKHKATVLIYIILSIFCVVFGAIYEIFSHEVYSFFMIYAFVFPLIGGAFIFFLFDSFLFRYFPGAISRNLYHSGIAALTVGSIIKGVLEIYGTTNRLINIYFLCGVIFILSAITTYLISILYQKRSTSQNTTNSINSLYISQTYKIAYFFKLPSDKKNRQTLKKRLPILFYV